MNSAIFRILLLASTLSAFAVLTACSPPRGSEPSSSTPSTEAVLARHEIAVRECTEEIRHLYPPFEQLSFANWTDDGWNPDPTGATRGYWVYDVDVTAHQQNKTRQHSCKLSETTGGQYFAKVLPS